MASESTTIHGPADQAPFVTNLYAKCNFCGVQWQIKSPNLDDAKACSFCGVTDERGGISILYEGPSDTAGAVVRQGRGAFVGVRR